MRAAAPSWPDRMDDVARAQPVSLGDPRLTGWTTTDGPALFQEFRTGRAVDGAVNAAASKQRLIGRVYDGIDREPGDVPVPDLNSFPDCHPSLRLHPPSRDKMSAPGAAEP